MSPASRSDAIRSLSLASRSAVAAETPAGRGRRGVGSGATGGQPEGRQGEQHRRPSAFRFPVEITVPSPQARPENRGSLHGQSGVAGEVRIGLRPLTEREDRAARVGDQALVAAAVAEAGVGTAHRSASVSSRPSGASTASAVSSTTISASIATRSSSSSGPKRARLRRSPTYSPLRWARSSGSVETDDAGQQLVHALRLLERLIRLPAHHLELLARDLHQVVRLLMFRSIARGSSIARAPSISAR